MNISAFTEPILKIIAPKYTKGFYSLGDRNVQIIRSRFLVDKNQKDADRMEYRKRFMELQDALDKAETRAEKDVLLNKWDVDSAEGFKAPVPSDEQMENMIKG